MYRNAYGSHYYVLLYRTHHAGRHGGAPRKLLVSHASALHPAHTVNQLIKRTEFLERRTVRVRILLSHSVRSKPQHAGLKMLEVKLSLQCFAQAEALIL